MMENRQTNQKHHQGENRERGERGKSRKQQAEKLFYKDSFSLVCLLFIIMVVMIGIFFGRNIYAILEKSQVDDWQSGVFEEEKSEKHELYVEEATRAPENISVFQSGDKPVAGRDIERNLIFLDNVEINSQSVTVFNRESNTYIMDREGDKSLFMASLTKLMTVLVALEMTPFIEEKVLMDASIFNDLYTANASMAGFLPGEIVSLKDLLYGSILPSGGDASLAIAIHLAGTEEAYVTLMNEKARELSMENTHFTNVTGLHDDNHYASGKDLVLLLDYALENDSMRDILMAPAYVVQPTNSHELGFTMRHTLFAKEEAYGFIVGGKTGYTEKSGLSLASLCLINNEEYIIVLLGAPGNPRSQAFHMEETERIAALIAEN